MKKTGGPHRVPEKQVPPVGSPGSVSLGNSRRQGQTGLEMMLPW